MNQEHYKLTAMVFKGTFWSFYVHRQYITWTSENLQPLSSKKFQRCYPLRKRIWSKKVLATNQMALNQLKQKILKRCGRQSSGTISDKGIRGFKEPGCQKSDFTVTERYIECKERQTKNRQGDESTSCPRLRELFPPNSIISSFRRPKNLKEILEPSKCRKRSSQSTAVPLAGCFKCDKTRCGFV